MGRCRWEHVRYSLGGAAGVASLTARLWRGDGAAGSARGVLWQDGRTDVDSSDAEPSRFSCGEVDAIQDDELRGFAALVLGARTGSPGREAARPEMGPQGAAATALGLGDPTSFAEAVCRLAAQRPQALAACGGGAALTYQELADQSARIAAGLRQRLVAASDAADEDGKLQSVASLMRRSPALLAAYVAAARCGAPLVPLSLDHRSRGEEDRRWQDALEVSRPVLVMVDTPGLQRWSEMPSPKPPAETLDDLAGAHAADSPGAPGWPTPGPASLLALVFTGGTTRKARCVRVAHGMALHELRRYREAVPLRDAGERVLQLSSAYWGAALLGEVDVALGCGGTVVFTGAGTPEEIWAAVQQHSVSVLGIVPALLAHLPAEEARRSTALRVVLSWADGCPAALAQRWRAAGVEVVELLIASEYWLALSARGPGAHGHPLYHKVQDVQWRIALDGEAEAAEGQVGELWLAGPMVSPGYHGKACSTFPCVEHEGVRYLRTGDLVRRARDGVEFLGRRDMMTKSAGKWLDLLHLEQSLSAAPGVAEAAVVVDSEAASRPQAFLLLASCSSPPPATDSHVAAPGMSESADGSPLAAAGVTARAVRSALAGASVSLHLVPASAGGLPRNLATHKVDARGLAELCALSGCEATEMLAAGVAAARARQFAATALAGVAVGCLWPRLLLRIASLPYVWVSALLLNSWAGWWQPVATWPRMRRLWAVQRYPTTHCLLALAAPQRLWAFMVAPGLAWALRSGRVGPWAVVFWLVRSNRLACACADAAAAAAAAPRRSASGAGAIAGTAAALSRACMWAQLRAAGLPRAAARRLGAWPTTAAAGAAPWARFHRAAQTFNGCTWFDSSGHGRHATVTYGAPRLDLTKSVAFRPSDTLLISREPLPEAFTLLAAARLCSPALKVTVSGASAGCVEGFALVAGGPRRVRFGLQGATEGCFPEVLRHGGGERVGLLGGSWSARTWRLVEINGQSAWGLAAEAVQAGSELLLQERTGQERVLAADDGFVGGWMGSTLGTAKWGGVWRAWSERQARGGLHVVALRNQAGGAVAFVDGVRVEGAAHEGCCSVQRHGNFGINTQNYARGRGHCAVFEVSIYCGHAPDEDIMRLSSEMSERAARATAGVATAALSAQVPEAVLDALTSGLSAPPSPPQGAPWGPRGTDHGVDCVDLPEVSAASPPRAPPRQHEQAAPEVGPACCDGRVRALLERALGAPVSPLEPLAGLGSLQLMRVAGALQRELGAAIGSRALMEACSGCVDLPGLEALVEAAAPPAPAPPGGPSGGPTSAGASAAERPVWTAEGLLHAPMHWTLRAPAPLDAAALRRALARLCARHAPLRSRMEGPADAMEEVGRAASEAAAVMSMMQHCSGVLQRALAPVLAWAVRHSWPRMRTEPPAAAAHAGLLHEVEVEDDRDLASKVGYFRNRFAPPCSFTLLRCREPRVDHVLVVISHSLCDAGSFGPLRADLAALYREEAGGPCEQLRPVPDALGILERRFLAAFPAKPGGAVSEEASYVAGWASSAAGGPAPWGHRRLLKVGQGAGSALQRASEALNVPLDVLFIVSIVCALARCDQMPVVRLTLTVPMRDGPDEGSLVGFFTDWRNVDVQTHALQSLLSVALQATEALRSRSWSRGTVSETSHRILVNLVGAEPTEHLGWVNRVDLGCMRPPSGWSAKASSREERPLEVQGWQTGLRHGGDPPAWTLVLKLQWERYPPAWAQRFAVVLTEVIEQFALDPCAPVHPSPPAVLDAAALGAAATAAVGAAAAAPRAPPAEAARAAGPAPSA
ncbi:unnamed protein product [Prorocentrum cordatum]|uniref:AMP-dependent synthetase/ligase domain-containing protein n=1 Tax=Prorocentrum cordatum TaxID=2364126 RepID=A0ABN9U112_9DINO|nr:unnamed protein product [Polarella glacialis]